MSAEPVPSGPQDRLKKKQEFWALWKTRLEVAQIVVIVLIGAGAVGLFYLWQASEAHNRYYADLQAERERADSALRAEMFQTLVSAYFRRAGEPSPSAAFDEKARAGAGAPSLAQMQRDIMLSDLLSRNFDTIDVRPLFEDLDRRLSQQQLPRETNSTVGHQVKERKAERLRALELREQLRRVAASATSRQRGQLNFPVKNAVVTSCPSKAVRVETWGEREKLAPGAAETREAGDQTLGDVLKGLSSDPTIAFKVVGLHDAQVFMEGLFGGVRAISPQFTVSYYDMPLLEQVRLPTNERVAFSVTRYVSYATCHSKELDASMSLSERQDVEGICKDLDNGCERARLAITTFPEDYIAARDRPFLTELTKKQKSLGDLIGLGKTSTPATLTTTTP